MINIMIDSFYGDKLIYGKNIDKSELEKSLDDILKIVDERDFLGVFCERHGFIEMPYDETIEIAYVIDLDTHKIYTPYS